MGASTPEDAFAAATEGAAGVEELQEASLEAVELPEDVPVAVAPQAVHQTEAESWQLLADAPAAEGMEAVPAGDVPALAPTAPPPTEWGSGGGFEDAMPVLEMSAAELTPDQAAGVAAAVQGETLGAPGVLVAANEGVSRVEGGVGSSGAVVLNPAAATAPGPASTSLYPTWDSSAESSWADAIPGGLELLPEEIAAPAPSALPPPTWDAHFEPFGAAPAQNAPSAVAASGQRSAPVVTMVPPGMKPAAGRATPPVWSNPPAPPPDDADLWGLVQGQPQELGAPPETLEQALQRTDDVLEDLMSLELPTKTTSAPPIADLVEASIEEEPASGPAPGFEKSATMASPAHRADDHDWLWDEDDLAGEPSDPAEAARLRRQRLLRRAMDNLGGIPQRPTGRIANAAPVSETPAASAAAPVAPAAAAPAPEVKADDQAMAALIEKRFDMVQAKADHFAILGIERQASRDQVKSAFLSLAKLFHPDRLPPSLQALAPKMTQIFESIRDAYETLYDDSKRESYVSRLKVQEQKAAVRAKATPAQEAMEAFRQGEAHLRKKDYAAADAEFARASSLDNKALYLAARGWLFYADPARKDVAKAKQMMSDAAKLDPNCDRAHYHLGLLARIEGAMDKAEKHFRDAVRANPKHVEANQELRLIDMRRKKGKL